MRSTSAASSRCWRAWPRGLAGAAPRCSARYLAFAFLGWPSCASASRRISAARSLLSPRAERRLARAGCRRSPRRRAAVRGGSRRRPCDAARLLDPRHADLGAAVTLIGGSWRQVRRGDAADGEGAGAVPPRRVMPLAIRPRSPPALTARGPMSTSSSSSPTARSHSAGRRSRSAWSRVARGSPQRSRAAGVVWSRPMCARRLSAAAPGSRTRA